MRMAELSRESGVPVATIKYYLREGLLPPGERTSPNQAYYDESHLRRLKLIRALLEVGKLSIASVREVLAAIDDKEASTHQVLGIAQHGLPMPRSSPSEQSRAWAQELVDRIAQERGWRLRPGNPVVETLLNALSTFAEIGRPELVGGLSEYAKLAERIAVVDLDQISELSSLEQLVEGAVVGTVLGDVILAALRRLAQAHVSAQRFTQ